MKVKYQQTLTALAAVAMLAMAPLAHGAIVSPVTGWTVHNGASTPGGTPSAPTFTGVENLTLMAPFDDIELANDGDYVEVTTTLEMNGRTTTGTNSLNTQLRIGLFDGPAGAIGFEDAPNLGFIIEYSNVAAGGLIREQESAIQNSPFTSPTNLGDGDTPTGNIVGADPPPVTFTLRMTRNGGALDLTGSIVSSTYTGNYALAGNSSAHFPLNGTFNFNRVGLWMGPNVDAADVALTNSAVETNVPEPSTCMLGAMAALACVAIGRRSRREAARS